MSFTIFNLELTFNELQIIIPDILPDVVILPDALIVPDVSILPDALIVPDVSKIIKLFEKYYIGFGIVICVYEYKISGVNLKFAISP